MGERDTAVKKGVDLMKQHKLETWCERGGYISLTLVISHRFDLEEFVSGTFKSERECLYANQSMLIDGF